MDYDRKSQKSHVKMQMEKMVNMDKMDSANFTKEEKNDGKRRDLR